MGAKPSGSIGNVRGSNFLGYQIHLSDVEIGLAPIQLQNITPVIFLVGLLIFRPKDHCV